MDLLKNGILNPDQTDERILGLVTEIVSGYVKKNPVSSDALPDLIQSVHQTLADLARHSSNGKTKQTPAVPADKSVTKDYIICLEDGEKLKMLKRHLKTAYDMTPEQYRERWGLSADTRALLEARGHRIVIRGAQGRVHGIRIDLDSGLRYGASDPRAFNGGVAGE